METERNGTRGVNDEVRDEIRRLYERDGEVRPSVVVTEAHKVKSPLHAMFEWDDAKAANLHRLDTARKIIRTCTVIVGGREDVLVHVPSINPETREGVSKPASIVVKIEDERERALREINNMIEGLIQRLDLLGDIPAARRAKKALTKVAEALA